MQKLWRNLMNIKLDGNKITEGVNEGIKKGVKLITPSKKTNYGKIIFYLSSIVILFGSSYFTLLFSNIYSK